MAGPVVITGGGTGGHIFPMQAVAQQLRLFGLSSNELRYVGSRRGQEATLLRDDSIALTLLPGRGIRRSLSPSALLENVGAVAALATAVAIATYKIARWRPAVVVSLGGYASLGVGVAAVLWRRPLVLVDLDAVPGAAHRLLGRFATRRCTSFASNDPRAVVTGAPLRDAIVAIDRGEANQRRARTAASPPIDQSRCVIVVMTGSLGALSVNRAVSDLARQWSDRGDITLVHVTGRRDYSRVVADRPTTTMLDYRIEEFADMTTWWTICDVAICRAGALTLAELTALGIASVLVPLPGAPGDHQTKNAQRVVDAHGALQLRDEDCSAVHLATLLERLLVPATRAAMSACARTLGRRDSARAIARVVLDVGGLS